MADSDEVIIRKGLEALISKSATFQTATGAIDEAAALLFIHTTEVDLDSVSADDYPLVVLHEPGDWNAERVTRDRTLVQSTWMVTFIDVIPPVRIDKRGEIDDWKALSRAFANLTDAVRKEIQQLSENEGPVIRSIKQEGPPEYSTPRRRIFFGLFAAGGESKALMRRTYVIEHGLTASGGE